MENLVLANPISYENIELPWLFTFLVEAKTNFFPSRENIGKLEKKKGQARRENRD
jgi:hypothetical protein